MARQRGRTLIGPGAASAAEFEQHVRAALSPARFLSLLIATGIGLHNFSEGLAIGQSAAKDQMSLALMLIIGFGLHNATEGFGIVAPLCGDRERPSWRFLALLGLVGGGPTFFGTLIGKSFVSVSVEILFLALAAGSILYVVMELFGVMRRLGSKVTVGWSLFAGLVLGFGTDFVLHAVGA
jgi:ZIP family zinc transporter